MAEQKAKTIRELDSFGTGELSLNDYLVVASNSAGPNITRKATLEEIFQKYTAQQTGGDGFSELVDQGLVDVISEGAPIWEALKGSRYVTIRLMVRYGIDFDQYFTDRVTNFFKPGATVDIDGDHYIVEEAPTIKEEEECNSFGPFGECRGTWKPLMRLKLTTPLSRTYVQKTYWEDRFLGGNYTKFTLPSSLFTPQSYLLGFIFIKEIVVNTTESSPNASASAANLYDGALDIKSKVQKLKGDPSRTSKVGAVTFDMSQITAYNLQDYVDATPNKLGLQTVYDCYNAAGNPVDCTSGNVSVKSKRLSIIGHTGELLTNVTMSNSETIVSGIITDLIDQGEIDEPTFKINKFVIPKQLQTFENGILIQSQYYIGAFLEYGWYAGGKWYGIDDTPQYPNLAYGFFQVQDIEKPEGSWIFFADVMGWYYLPSNGITSPNSYEKPFPGWWMWNESLGWHWTNPEIFPYAYVHSYFKGTQDLVGWIYFEIQDSDKNVVTSRTAEASSRTGKIYIYDQTSGSGARSKWVNINSTSFDPANSGVTGGTAPSLSNSIKNAHGTDAPVVVVPAR
jgi:hypothetical protein